MIVATYKCGCPPPPKEEKPPCSPCCAAGKNISAKPTDPQDCLQSPCCKKHPPKGTISLPKIEEPPPCCPLPPDESDEFQEPRKLRSEIAEAGLPYDELEVTINNNKLVMRTLKEEVKPEYDPPCECVEDPEDALKGTKEIDQPQVPGNKTVTLYPQAKEFNQESNGQNGDSEEEELDTDRTLVQEENPNIFVFRVKKRSAEGDKKFCIDLEFKTPRPWSLQKRLEYEEKIKLRKPAAVVLTTSSTTKKDSKKGKKKGDKSSIKQKKK